MRSNIRNKQLLGLINFTFALLAVFHAVLGNSNHDFSRPTATYFQRQQKHHLLSAFASKSIPPPPPISVPVYSLASSIPVESLSKSEGSSDGRNRNRNTSMNIMTFCTPVSVAPPKLWTLSLYSNTMTKDYFFESKIGVLQLLDKKQCDLVPILGKRSGYELDYSKELECEKIGFKWGRYCDDKIDSKGYSANEEENGLLQSTRLLPNCQSYIKVRLLEAFDAGDHEVALCQVLGVGEWNDQEKCVIDVDVNANDAPKPKDENIALYSGYLRQKGII